MPPTDRDRDRELSDRAIIFLLALDRNGALDGGSWKWLLNDFVICCWLLCASFDRLYYY